MEFFIHHADSLKSKRRVVKRLVSLIKNKFNAACAEVAGGNLWQRTVIGVAVLGNDASFVNSHLDKIVNYAESLDLAEMINHQIEILSYSDGDFL
ncbi:MAG: DUF503 domain-containing protein [Deltaproteobacteria bacterium]|uniref:DUF503 domain-containing protein n=1 Tax=Candidatus Zymogenus saltonus TaxID=2844893 RepID=A0A9D8PR39_9DELT|nr:DUF503 domain-containing protein [Candidatus Zymogenus saltonus]